MNILRQNLVLQVVEIWVVAPCSVVGEYYKEHLTVEGD
jgi:hypothetical protein